MVRGCGAAEGANTGHAAGSDGGVGTPRDSGRSKRRRMPTRRSAAAVGGALFYVHAVGVLHRDVKPANVLLSRRSHRIKLADFGIAKLVQATTLRAQTVVGTPYYWSPEIVSGEEFRQHNVLGGSLVSLVQMSIRMDMFVES